MTVCEAYVGEKRMLSLAISVLAIAVVLLVPGYCLLRAVGVARTWSVALAPAISAAVLSLLGELYLILGIDSTPLSLLLIPTVLFLIVAAVRRFPTDALALPKLSVKTLALYVFVGFVVGYLMFVRPMGSSDSYFRGVDLVQHLNEIRAFIDSKTFTSFHASYYLADPAIDPAPVHYFYPSGYHVVCALAAMICGQGLTVIINACNLFACAAVWTIGLAALFSYLFEDVPRAIVLGSLVGVGASIFPWGLLIFGPIFPNLLSFAMVPTVVVLFAFALRDGVVWWQRVIALLLMVVALAGIALTQPNAAFTAAVFLIPYVGSRILSLRGRELKGLKKPLGWPAVLGLCVLWLALCVVIWIWCLYFKPLRGIVTFVWDFKKDWLSAVLNALVFTNVYSFGFVAWQPLMGALAIVGGIYVIVKKKLRWLGWAALFGQVLCFVCLTNDPPLKNYVGGFWYTDPWRMSCMAIMLTLPLCVLALVWAAELLEKGLGRLAEKRAEAAEEAETGAVAPKLAKRMRPLPAGAAVAIVVAIYIVANFWGALGTVEMPEEQGLMVPTSESAWTCIRRTVYIQYRLEAPYTHEERAFTRKVRDLVGDAVVLNDPYDGSVISYGADGLHTYYRYARDYGEGKETEDSIYLRAHISDVASDKEVQRILKEQDVHYLMKLSHDDYHDAFFMGAELLGRFVEVEDIDNDTPGFEAVLEEDGMVLYRITAID